jgi:hypothetical protein
MEQKIIEKKNILDKMNDEFNDYFTRLKPILSDIYRFEIINLMQKFEEYMNFTSELENVIQVSNVKKNKKEMGKNEKKNEKSAEKSEKSEKDIEKDIEKIMHLAHILNLLDITIEDEYSILSSFNVHSLEYVTNMSKSYILETETILHDMNKKYILFKNGNDQINMQIIDIFADILMNWITSEIDIFICLKYIQNSFETYIESIHLYANIMQKIILTQTGESMFLALKLLEKSKTLILSKIQCFNVYKGKNSDIYDNPLISTFGLIPICESNNLQNIIQNATKTMFSSKLKESNLSNIAKKLKIGIIIFYKVVKNPIEFSLWKLLIAPENKLLDPTNGINNETIKRFKTIFYTAEESQTKHAFKWDFDIKYYGISDVNNFLILDTLDGLKYRILLPWKSRNPDINTILPKYRIPFILLNYIKNKNTITTRLDNYNQIMIKKAQSTMFLDSIVNFDKIEKISHIYESKYLRHSLYNEIKLEYDELVSNKEDIKNLVQFSDLIHSDNIYDKFTEVILNYYNEYIGINQSLLDKLNFPYSEILVTFLSYLRNLTIDFKKEIHTQYLHSESSLNANIFTDISNSEKLSKLNKVFENILLTTLNTIITDETNIYQTALKKYQMLLIY